MLALPVVRLHALVLLNDGGRVDLCVLGLLLDVKALSVVLLLILKGSEVLDRLVLGKAVFAA